MNPGRRSSRPSWKQYQAELKSALPPSGRRTRMRRSSFLFACFSIVFLFFLTTNDTAVFRRTDARAVTPPATPHSPERKTLTKDELESLLSTINSDRLLNRRIRLDYNGVPLFIDTTIDPDFQQYAAGLFDRDNSHIACIAALTPDTGRILAMTGFNDRPPHSNPCMKSRFPAASVFKIVTAAAAIEQKSYTADSRVDYTGGKYTLYRSQLKQANGSRGRFTTFQDSFAQSINPVFGKIGRNVIGSKILQDYAEAFGFNRRITDLLPLPPSRIRITNDPYELAEIASGFNRKTRITAVHGGLISATIINDGEMVTPVLVESVRDETGALVYVHTHRTRRRVVDPSTAAALKRLMAATIQSGTCKKTFRGCDKDSVLGRLEMGGKTGYIGNEDGTLHYDWFVGFARDRKTDRKLAIAVMVAHGAQLAPRARTLARLLFRKYFQLHL